MPNDAAIRHRTVETNGIRLHVAEAGVGPLVVLCHGWPETWYSWRHQLPALAAAGYHAVAPDQRGYGQSDCPESVEQYTQLHLVGDLIGLLDALGAEQAVVVGHDWGAPVAWNTALLRPDRIRAVVALSVPYPSRSRIRPSVGMIRATAGKFFYQLYFQEPGVAEAELEADPRPALRRIYYSLSGDPPPDQRWQPVRAGITRLLEDMTDPATLPAWLTNADLDEYAAAFRQSGFRGGLNWYRTIERSWELLAPFAGLPVRPPALFIGGTADPVWEIPGSRVAFDRMARSVPNLREPVLLEGCGHWTQQERPAEVNRRLLDFLRSLDG